MKHEIAISEQDAWRIYELLEQMNDFLHQPANYGECDAIKNWLGSGVYAELNSVFYGVVAKWFEPDRESGRVVPPAGIRRRFPE